MCVFLLAIWFLEYQVVNFIVITYSLAIWVNNLRGNLLTSIFLMNIRSSKSVLERFGIHFIDWASSHDFVVIERSQLALFTHLEIRLLQWWSHISWGVHHYLVAVNRVSSLLIVTSEVILGLLVVGYETRAILLLGVHWFLSWDHMVRSVDSWTSGETVNWILSSSSALNNTLKSLVAVLKPTLLLLINSFHLGCVLLLLILIVTVGTRIGSASLLLLTAWSSVERWFCTFILGTSERFMASLCWWSGSIIAVSFVQVIPLAELLEHMHEKTLHTLHAVALLVFSFFARCWRLMLLGSLTMLVWSSTVHMVMRRREHSHKWWHETV